MAFVVDWFGCVFTVASRCIVVESVYVLFGCYCLCHCCYCVYVFSCVGCLVSYVWCLFVVCLWFGVCRLLFILFVVKLS